MSEQTIPIPARIKNMAVGGHVAGSDDIYDETLKKEQHELNNNFNSDITDLKDRVEDIRVFQEAVLEIEENYADITTQNDGKVPSVVATAGVKNHIESNIGYYVCETPAATAIKTIAAPYYNLINGGSIRINFTQGNSVTSGLKLNIGSVEAKDVVYTNPDTGDSSFLPYTVLTIYYNSSTYVAENYKDDIKHNTNLLNLLAKGAKVTVNINPSTIYKGEEQSYQITVSPSEFTPDSYKILDSIEPENVLSNSNTYTASNVILTDNSKTYYGYGVKTNCNIVGKAIVQARYPIFYGFGVVYTDPVDDLNLVAPTTTASRTYSKTLSSGSNKKFFILVPSDIAKPTTFVMNGAPFVMTRQDDITIRYDNRDITGYTVFTSGEVYNAPVTLKVTAN